MTPVAAYKLDIAWFLNLQSDHKEWKLCEDTVRAIKRDQWPFECLSPFATNQSKKRHFPLLGFVEAKSPTGRAPEEQMTSGAFCAITQIQLLRNSDAFDELPPPIPCFNVRGHDWILYLICVTNKDDAGIPLATEPNLRVAIKEVAILRTNTFTGVVRTYAVLNLLMKWGTTTYKDWFLSTVLKSTANIFRMQRVLGRTHGDVDTIVEPSAGASRSHVRKAASAGGRAQDRTTLGRKAKGAKKGSDDSSSIRNGNP